MEPSQGEAVMFIIRVMVLWGKYHSGAGSGGRMGGQTLISYGGAGRWSSWGWLEQGGVYGASPREGFPWVLGAPW